MKTAVFYGIEDLRIEECPLPEVSENKILIKIEACALCTWEQRVYTGVKKVDYPFIGGHEIAAEIVALGNKIDPTKWQIGDKVVFGTNLACGDCDFCKSGEEQNCIDFNHSKHLEGLPHKGMGGLSEYMLVEPKHLFHYFGVTPEEAALTEPLSCVVHSCETANIQYGDLVVVIGCGIMGLLHVALTVKSGARVLACDLNPERLELAKKIGAHYIIDSSKEDLLAKVKEISHNLGANVVFDTTPIHSVAEESVELVSNTGKVILYSSFYPDEPVSFSPDKLHKGGYSIAGTANSNSRDFVRASRMISERVIDMRPFISEIIPFEEVVAGFESAIKGDKYRVVIKF
ncbi:zinc-binding dehydrogenase [Enterococcus avium]|uniref:zinc-binding dehydrogenase n=1 Tax=Enterococcus avium TaxID=33945 RepID=UPI0034D245A1